MGNCQTAETAAPVAEILHPGGKREFIYWPLKASYVMAANPGYYVAVVTDAVSDGGERWPGKQVKLLRPEDILSVGHVHRLVSYEEVIREFGKRKRMKLSRLLLEQKRRDERRSNAAGAESRNNLPEKAIEEGPDEFEQCAISNDIFRERQRQWTPSLHSIAETGN